MIFFTSDQHFDHENIIKYCNRPFSSLKGMNDSIIEKWNNKVNKDDRVYVLGDFALSSLERIYHFLSTLNGEKILIRGNHDRHSHKKYLEAGFKRSFQKINVEEFLLTHRPNYNEHRKIWNLCGHVHEKWKVNEEQKILNVGVDVWGFEPVGIDEIRSFVENIELLNEIRLILSEREYDLNSLIFELYYRFDTTVNKIEVEKALNGIEGIIYTERDTFYI